MAAPPDPALARIGTLPVARFLRQYWQRAPLMMRAALPLAAPVVTRAQLLALAARDDVESRLVTHFDGRWALRHGPFGARALPARSHSGWTLLVQGVDLVHRPAHALLRQFRFLPDARLDDIMVSVASDGGGVGPHVDHYDVFLLQVAGRRRWRISTQRDVDAVADLPLRVLRNFRAEHEWVLEPGDLLYLPPGVAHEGTAVGECITCSIGFRAPTWEELLDPWQQAVAEQWRAQGRLAGRYADPGLAPQRHPARLPPSMGGQVHRALAALRPTVADTEAFLLQHLSEPKAQVVFDRVRPLAPAAFARRAVRAGVRLDARTRMLYAGARLAINGELIDAPVALRRALRRLADARALDGARVQRASAALLALLREWHAAGWIDMADDA